MHLAQKEGKVNARENRWVGSHLNTFNGKTKMNNFLSYSLFQNKVQEINKNTEKARETSPCLTFNEKLSGIERRGEKWRKRNQSKLTQKDDRLNRQEYKQFLWCIPWTQKAEGKIACVMKRHENVLKTLFKFLKMEITISKIKIH